MAVHKTGRNSDRLSDLSIGQHKCAAGGSTDVDACRLPLVADGTQAVGVSQRVGGRQGSPLDRLAGDRHAARRRLVRRDSALGRIVHRHRSALALQRRSECLSAFCEQVSGETDGEAGLAIGAHGGVAAEHTTHHIPSRHTAQAVDQNRTRIDIRSADRKACAGPLVDR